MQNKPLIYLILLSLLLTDIGFSFLQFMGQPLDGDMAYNLVPSREVKPVFENPLGFNALIKNQTYANPNRFFSHWIFRKYLINVPLKLQKYVDPINSVYLSCAISKTIIQLIIIVLLSMAITGSSNLLKTDFLIAAVLVTPLFQTNGYRDYMGIIDISTTYTFFYALPIALLLLYFMPFFFEQYHNKTFVSGLFIKIVWIPLAIVVCLSGPLNPGIILVSSFLILMVFIINTYKHSNQYTFFNKLKNSIFIIPKSYWFFLLPVCILSIYSLYLGRYNIYTITNRLPLDELYSRIPKGIYYQFTQKLGFPVLFLILTVNTILIYKKYKTTEGKRILNIFKWIGIFSACYILLLPLGGYRNYRPNILRYDSIMPVTLGLMFIFGTTTLFLFRNMSIRQKFWYVPVILLVLFIYVNSDEPKFDNNICEKTALQKIAGSDTNIVELEEGCSVLSWGKIKKPQKSGLNAELLCIWKITDRKKLYYNK